jgi:hypothetical protein
VTGVQTCALPICDGNNTLDCSRATGDGLYLWGAQLEQGTSPTSYIPTEESAVTKTADNLYYTGDFDDVKSITYEIVTPTGFQTSDTTYPRTLTLSDGTYDNRIEHGMTNQNMTYYCSIETEDTIQGTLYSPNDSLILGANAKLGSTLETDNANHYLNGVKVATDTTVTLPTGLNQLNIGSRLNGTLQLNGIIRNVKLYKKVLSQKDMEGKTTL